MTRSVWLVAAVIGVVGVRAADPERGPMPRELKPQWQRMLTGEDVKKAADLQKSIVMAVSKDDVKRFAKELLALRLHVQGEDHWQVQDARQYVTELEHALTTEQVTKERKAIELDGEVARLVRQKRFRDAAPLAEQSLGLRVAALGERFRDTATCRSNVAYVYAALGRYSEAESLYRMVLTAREQMLGHSHPDTADVTLMLGRLHRQNNRPEEALKLSREGVSILRATLGDGHAKTISAFNDLVDLCLEQGNYRDAEALLKDALSGRVQMLGAKHPDTANVQFRLATVYYYQRRYAESEVLYTQALDTIRAVLGKQHIHVGRILSHLAALYDAEGRFASAEPLYLESLDIHRRELGDANRETATVLGNLAYLYDSQGRYAVAEPLYLKALSIKRTLLGPTHKDLAPVLHNLGHMYIVQERYAEAERLVTEALAICRSELGPSHETAAACLSTLGLLCRRQKRYEQAAAALEESLAIFRTTRGDLDPKTAVIRHNLALTYEAQERYGECEPLFREALTQSEKTAGELHPNTNLCRLNLAMFYAARGRYTDARPLLEMCVRSHEIIRLARARSVDRAVGYVRRDPYPLLAAVLARSGNSVEAYRAIEFHMARGLLDEISIREAAHLSEKDEARRAVLSDRLNKTSDQILRLTVLTTPSDDERQQLQALRAEREAIESEMVAIAAGLSRSAVSDLRTIQATLDPSAAILLWTDIGSPEGHIQEHWACVVRSTGEPKWEQLPGTGAAGEWLDSDSDLPGLLRLTLRSKAANSEKISSLVDRLRKQRLAPVEKHLTGVRHLWVIGTDYMGGIPIESLSPSRQVEYIPSGTAVARAKAKQKLTGPPSVLAIGDPAFPPPEPVADRPLPPSGLLVETVVPGGAAFNVLKPGDVLLSYGGTDVADADALGRAIAANAQSKTVPATIWRVTDTGKAVTKPAELAPGRLGVTLAKEPARDALAARYKTDQQLAAATRSGRVDPKTGQKVPWAELPGTAVELASLKELFQDKATVLARSDASEQKLDELRRADQLKNYRYLHFATHGQANNDKAFESFLVLAQDKLPKYEGKEGEKAYRGELTAREVLDHWHLDADLVTLSACESGLGRSAGGDGLLGFAQAFLVAGARSVCLTLWEVDDTATALLMDRFYRNLLGKRDGLTEPMKKAAALREAKEWLRNLTADEVLRRSAAMRKGVRRGLDAHLPDPVNEKAIAPKGDLTVKPYADPRFWAAFIIIGDPD